MSDNRVAMTPCTGIFILKRWFNFTSWGVLYIWGMFYMEQWWWWRSGNMKSRMVWMNVECRKITSKLFRNQRLSFSLRWFMKISWWLNWFADTRFPARLYEICLNNHFTECSTWNTTSRRYLSFPYYLYGSVRFSNWFQKWFFMTDFMWSPVCKTRKNRNVAGCTKPKVKLEKERSRRKLLGFWNVPRGTWTHLKI